MTFTLTTPIWIALTASLALLLSLLGNRWLIVFCHRYDILDQPRRHKRHQRPTPHIGGVVVFFALTLALIPVFMFSETDPADSVPLLALALGGAIIFAVGLIDDLRPISAMTKLLAQTAAGVVLYLGGVVVDPLYVPFVGEVAVGYWGVLISVFWVALISNAINLIDGLDGLATGVSLIGAVSLGAIAYLLQVREGVIICSALAGVLTGTLYFNIYPARLFLGDSGALLIGYVFAALSLIVPIKSYSTAALFLPLLALGVPLLETGTSFFRRLISGKSVLRPDRRHLFHYLGYLGLSHRATVRVFWFLSGLCGLMSVGMLFWDRRLALLVLAAVMVAVFALFVILMRRVRRTGAREGQ